MTLIFPTLGSDALEVLWQMFRDGPVWDGDLCSKHGRGELVKYGYAARYQGWQTLTMEGLSLAVDNGMGDRKEVWNRKRRRRAAP